MGECARDYFKLEANNNSSKLHCHNSGTLNVTKSSKLHCHNSGSLNVTKSIKLKEI